MQDKPPHIQKMLIKHSNSSDTLPPILVVHLPHYFISYHQNCEMHPENVNEVSSLIKGLTRSVGLNLLNSLMQTLRM